MISLIEKVESIAGKEDCAGWQHFLLFPQYFQNPSPSGCVVKGFKDQITSKGEIFHPDHACTVRNVLAKF